MIKILTVKKIGLFLLVSLLSRALPADEELSEVKITDLGNESYRLISKAKAAPGTIGSHSRSRMMATSCEAAKLRAKSELKRILPKVQHPSLYAIIEKTNVIQNGLYCEITMLYDRNFPKASRKSRKFRKSQGKINE